MIHAFGALQPYLGVAPPQSALPLPKSLRPDGSGHGSLWMEAVCALQAGRPRGVGGWGHQQ